MVSKLGRILYYSLFFLTPLIVLPTTSELFELNKMVFIYFVSISIAFLLSIQMIREKKIALSKTNLDLPILLFFGVQVLATVFSIDRHTSFFGYYGRFNGGLLSLAAYLVLFYGVFRFFAKKDIDKILRVSLISSTLVMLWGLPGRFGHDLSCLIFTGSFSNSCWTDQFRPAERMFSTLGQPNWLGAYLAINFFIGLYFLLSKKLKRWYLVYSYVLLTFICILCTKSRSAIIALAVGVLLYGCMVIWLKQKELFVQERKKLILLSLLFLASVVVFKTGIDTIDNLTKFSNKTQTTNTKSQTPQLSSEVTESLDIRKIVWKGAWALGLRYPLLGTGPETFAYSYFFTRPIEHNMTSEWDFIYNKAHNEYLNYLATSGFLGLITYVVFLSFVFKNFKVQISNDQTNNDQLLGTSLLCSYITILITNFFGFSTTTINIYFYLIPALVLLSMRSPGVQEIHETSKLSQQQKLMVGSVVIVYLLGLAWIVLFHYADTQYAMAVNYMQNGDYARAYESLRQARQFHYESVYEDRFSSITSNLAVLASYQGEKSLIPQLMNISELSNLRSLRDSPKNVLYWKTRTKNMLLFYQVTLDSKYLSQKDGSIDAINMAMQLAPSDPKLPYTKAILYSVLHDEEKDKVKKDQDEQIALQEVDKAIQLKPNYAEAKDLQKKLLTQFGKAK